MPRPPSPPAPLPAIYRSSLPLPPPPPPSSSALPAPGEEYPSYQSGESSGTLSPSAQRMLTTANNNNNGPTGDAEQKKERRRVQWAQAIHAVGADGNVGGGREASGSVAGRGDGDGDGDGNGNGEVLEEGDAQDKRERKERKRREDERLGRELDERGLDRAAFAALRLALQPHTAQPPSPPLDASSPSTPTPNQLLPDSEVYIPPDQTFGLPAPEPSGDAERGESGGPRGGASGWGWVMAATKLKRGLREGSGGEGAGEIPLSKLTSPPSAISKPPDKPSLAHIDSIGTPRPAMQPSLQGKGVLASLLTLYDPTRLESGATTPSSASVSELSTPDSDDSRGWPTGGKRKGALARVQTALSDNLDPGRPPPTHPHLRARLPHLADMFHLGPATPPAARSAGGVLGSLITTTANLSGAAAPIQSSIAPQPGRSGWHLARYDQDGEKEEEIDVEEEKRRVREERRRSWAAAGIAGWGSGSRPGSRAGSRPGSREGSDDDERTPLSGRGGASGDRQDPFEDPAVMSRTTTVNSAWSGVSEGTSDDGATIGGGGGRAIRRPNWPGALSLPRLSLSAVNLSPSAQSHHSSYFTWKGGEGHEEDEEEKEREVEREVERRKRRKAKKRRKESEIFITMHVAALLQRQEFLLKLARALMMFGAPTHRLEPLIQATARVLDMSVSCVYLPSLMLLSFNDESTRTSETKFLKQPTGLDLGRLQDVHRLYNAVIHDRTSVREAGEGLDVIMRGRARYRALVAVLIGGLCSAFITPISFQGSFLDAVLAFPLGCLLVLIQQLAARNELFTHVFEIVVALLLSFISAALASTGKVCYAAVASGSVVLILPGYIVLTGALELMSRNIISGSVRTMYSIIYSLFLGFGLAIGAEFWTAITGQQIVGLGVDPNTVCSAVHQVDGPWWQQPASEWWAFLCVPGFSFALSLRNQAHWKRKEFLVMILISCAGWTTSHFASLRFVNRSDVTAALGALVVGVCGNLYGRFFASGMAFVVMVTGILFQVPSSINGLLQFDSLSNQPGQDSYSAGWSIAEQLVEVSIGLTVGLFVAAVITHPFESRKRGAGLFSF